jgi:hypothetical protein
MAKSPVLLAGACVYLALLAAGCGGGGTSSSSQRTTARASTPVPQSRIQPSFKATCPKGFAGTAAKSQCNIAQVRVGLGSCKRDGAGGSDIRVSGISCQKGRGLTNLLTHGFAYHHAREAVYRTSTARGHIGHVVPLRASGWTCWAGFDPRIAEVWHACWRGSDVLLFKNGG